MTFGNHITNLRKRQGLSQNDLGKMAGTSGDLIGKYERDEVKPSIEVASKIADALQVSLDFLLGKTIIEISQQNLKRLQEIEQLDSEDQKHIIYTIDNLIKAAKLKNL